MFTSCARKVPWLGAVVLGLTLTPAVLANASPTVAQVGTPAASRYRLVDLGTLGGESSFATAVNDRSAVVGRAQIADGTYHGFLWRAGVMTDLGLFSPIGINNRAEVIGTRDDAGGSYVWSRGKLKLLPGQLRYPVAINDRGDVVGPQTTDGAADASVLVSNGKVRQLPLDTVSDINNRREVSGGVADGLDGFHASVWRRGTVTDLGAAAFNRSNTAQINDRGSVIGFTFSTQQFERSFVWRNGARRDLGTLGGELTRAIAINERGVVLVLSQVADGNLHPALWRNGALVDLSTRGVDADGDFVGFNNRGDIAGSIRPVFGIAHAVLYRPVPGT
jgi:probable HAF family extracellular repeat protein